MKQITTKAGLLLHITKRMLLITIAFSGSASWPHLVSAQTAPAPNPNGDRGELEQIIVTAERREANLQSVPIAVTALTEKRLEFAGVQGTEELTFVTPSLHVARLRQSASPFTRGVGTLTATAGFEAPVSLYVDGVYFPSLPAGFFKFNSVERIEVLKGPQGTLFGRNALGGVIQVITKDPSQTPEASVELRYGNYDTVAAEFYATGPLWENIAGDIAVNYLDQGEGYGENLVSGADVNWASETNIRSKLLWQGDETDIEVALDYSELDASKASYSIYPGTIGAGGVGRAPGFQNVALSIDPHNTTDQYGAGLRITHELDIATLVSITGYRNVENSQDLPSRLPTNIADLLIDETSESVTQELQLQSKSDGRLEWVLGGYLLRLKGEFDPLTVTGAAVAAIGSESRFSTIKTDSEAVFAQGTYSLTDATRVTAGIRYTHDKQSAEEFRTRPGVGVSSVTPLRSESWTEPTWKLSIDHHFTDDHFVYASYNRGFKSGSYTGSAPASPPVNPELIDSFEVGQKVDLFDNVVRLNTALYYFTHEDIQLTALRGTPPVGQLLNAAEGETYGLELEADIVPSDSLSIRAALAITEAEYKRFPGGPDFAPQPGGGNATLVSDFSGNPVVYVPDWTLSITGNYYIPTELGEFQLRASVYHSDEFTFTPSSRLVQPAYTTMSAGLSWTPNNSDLNIEIWGKNITDEEYWSFGIESPLADVVIASPPSTYGITLSMQFQSGE